jgi:hyperosmotically inducible periplasmic protein
VLAAMLVLRAPAGALGGVKKSDSRIRAQVEEALRADDVLGGSTIFVQSVRDGVVLLGGKSRTATDDLRAMADAARVPGVRRVASEIRSPDQPAREDIPREREPQPPTRREYGVAATRDAWITVATRLRLLADHRTPARDISVDTLEGVVTLFGMVPSVEARVAAGEEAGKVPGVKRVANALQVVPPSKQEAVKAHDEGIERAVRKALEDRSELRHARIDIDVRNGVARLTGTVPTDEQRVSAGLAARSAVGVASVRDDLRVSSRPWLLTPEHGSFGWEESKR